MKPMRKDYDKDEIDCFTAGIVVTIPAFYIYLLFIYRRRILIPMC